MRFLVMLLRTPQFQPALIGAHQAFLQSLRDSGQLELAGPFADKSGGAYLLKAASLQAAQALAFTDPLHTSGSSLVTVYQWDAQ